MCVCVCVCVYAHVVLCSSVYVVLCREGFNVYLLVFVHTVAEMLALPPSYTLLIVIQLCCH